MVKLIGLLSSLSSARILVIGDFMLDTYTTGKVRRISPEAPVSVLHVRSEESRPGGSGNVALNIVSLGGRVVVIGRVGADVAGRHLRDALEKEAIDVRGLFVQEGYRTPVKNRLIADSQQVLRVDFETNTPVPEDLEMNVIEELPSLMEDVQVIAISDYAKGFLSKKLLQETIALAKQRCIPVIVDPKGDDFSKYKGADIIKPNLSEAYAAGKLNSEEPLSLVAASIFEKIEVNQLLVTRSEEGISLFDRNGTQTDFPVRSREVKDVTGAGDTVLAMISVGLGSGIDLKSAIQLSNIAAGIAIERVGCARINIRDLASRLFSLDVDNKVFDEEHLFALQQALQGKRYCLLGIESKLGMSNTLFRAIRELDQRDIERELIIYIREDNPDEEFISLISSLNEVDFIVLKCDSLKNLLKKLHPHAIFSVNGDGLVEHHHANALLQV
jgi:D-glycero-beta-D-manno-heptose-7-phosphate kinase